MMRARPVLTLVLTLVRGTTLGLAATITLLTAVGALLFAVDESSFSSRFGFGALLGSWTITTAVLLGVYAGALWLSSRLCEPPRDSERTA